MSMHDGGASRPPSRIDAHDMDIGTFGSRHRPSDVEQVNPSGQPEVAVHATRQFSKVAL
jgi:hypothetical protein